MSKLMILRETQMVGILQRALEGKMPVVLSFFYDGQWEVVRALITKMDDSFFSLKITPRKKTSSSIMHMTRSVGVSLKNGFSDNNDRFVFDTIVSATDFPEGSSIGTITLAMPERIELVQRRNFVRVKVPHSLDVNVRLTRRELKGQAMKEFNIDAYHAWQGKLIDISAEGLSIAINLEQGPDFEIGQFIKIDFIPIPDETPLVFNAYVRNLSNSADGEFLCMGLEIIGLEASPEGRLVLQRICNTVEQYNNSQSQ